MSKTDLRMRVFAGPNGSGKSTIIEAVKNYKVKGNLIDFGIYINADDIAQHIRENDFGFFPYTIDTTNEEFRRIAMASGLINKDFTEEQFNGCYQLEQNRIIFHSNAEGIEKEKIITRLAQVIADFLRKRLLADRKKFSFETVFSHESKLEIMRQGKEAGYKVYLYFVSTESPEINKDRVALRPLKGGHYVPPETIVSRYYRSLDFLYEATKLSYRVFFFDNSDSGKRFKLFADFKVIDGKESWGKCFKEMFPQWFYKYFLMKSTK